MIKCRACLRSSTGLKMIAFNDEYILYFNLLTNLKIQPSDVKEHKLCEFCLEMLNQFIEFRNKCIRANSVLQCSDELEENIKYENIKEESFNIYDNATIDEIKAEPYEDQRVLSEGSFDNYENEDNCVYEIVLVNKDSKVRNPEESIPRPKIQKTAITQELPEKEEDKSNAMTGFPCGLCYKTFHDNNSLSKHWDSHISNKSCSICSERFIDWQQLLSHRINHVPWKKKNCHICFKRFQSSLYLEYHYKSVHSNEEKISLRCPHCNKSYVTPKQLKKHIWGCHSMKQFICDYCSKEFTNKHQIKIHMAVHMDARPHVCDQCEYSSKFSENLKNHKLRKHTPKSIHCNNCYRVFRNKLVYDSHKCSVKLTICSVCGKEFKGAKKLSRHMVSHETVCKYRCERCPAQYKTSDGLRAHRDRHDGVRSKRCEYCPKTFYTTSVLIKHRRTHTGIKPYVCKICQKAFTGSYNLKVHMRVHGEYVITKKNQNEENVEDTK